MQNICLKNKEDSTLLSYVATCYGSGLFANVEFICKDGVRVYSHMFYLSMVSEYLSEILEHQKNEDAFIVMLPDFDGGTVQELMRFIYEGRVDLEDHEQFYHLLKLLHVSTGEVIFFAPKYFLSGGIFNSKPVFVVDDKNDATSPENLQVEIDPSSFKSFGTPIDSETNTAMEEAKNNVLAFKSQECAMIPEDKYDLMEHSLGTESNDLNEFIPNVDLDEQDLVDDDIADMSFERLKIWLSKAQKLKCPKCEKLFGPSRLKLHLKVCDKHSVCEKCGKVFKRANYKCTKNFFASMCHHKKKCKGKRNQPKNCEICGKIVGTCLWQLKRHMKSCGMKRDCSVCGRVFKNAYLLRIHNCKGIGEN